ncbi:MFS transporter [Persicitalea jodogahamensis]|uniref:Glucarate transporter n=1 Tax=Persicitalea jodogahamensis TaxID=402147 RepID=A0A8J3D619_9BACT|nr:MFS transporter [Persicitalea jodogahamensis]GHB80193.1 glucarate transporter [Persicitalea jodogahamensis]
MPKRYWVVVGTFLLAMLLYVDRILISVAKPEVSASLSLSDKQMGWVLSIFSLGYALFQVPSGMLADRIGPRKTLTLIVSFWSAFTFFTGLAWNFASMLIIRFLFGAGEAGAYPSINRTVFSWIPVQERGMVNGINFSAGRIGAALALPGVAWLIVAIGWQWSFATLGVVGFGWALVWYFYFRDEPTQLASISSQEQTYILTHRQPQERVSGQSLPIARMLSDRNVLLLMGQYFASNFTFFFCLTWLFPHLMARFQLQPVEAAFYSSLPLVFGAVGNILAGGLVDGLYRRGYFGRSRTFTAGLGFLLAAIGLFFSIGSETAGMATFFLALAVLGADMTLSPSWAACSDIGGIFSGTVSGAMNMFGNLGAFFTALSFPYLQAWFGSDEPFFYIGVALNLFGILCWFGIKPTEKILLTKI